MICSIKSGPRIDLRRGRVVTCEDGYTHIFLKPEQTGSSNNLCQIGQASFSQILQSGEVPFGKNYKPKGKRGIHLYKPKNAVKCEIPLHVTKTPAGYQYDQLVREMKWFDGKGMLIRSFPSL
jgi:hypothetical protein